MAQTTLAPTGDWPLYWRPWPGPWSPFAYGEPVTGFPENPHKSAQIRALQAEVSALRAQVKRRRRKPKHGRRP